jgi:protease PrsW
MTLQSLPRPVGSVECAPSCARRKLTIVRRFGELQAWLVAEAEDTVVEAAAGDGVCDPPGVRAGLAELHVLKQALGRTNHAAVQVLLPFSRNELWELDELKQRLGRG